VTLLRFAPAACSTGMRSLSEPLARLVSTGSASRRRTVTQRSRSLDAAAAVRAALSSLPPRQRAVVVLHHFDGEDAAAIAATLGIAQVTVRWHLAAARKRLERILR
jgi:RNA polymerase sigma factor (sigma-70 family)